MITDITNKILNGYSINHNEAEYLIKIDLDKLRNCANKIREKYCGNTINLCSIINGKSGKCSENCKFCAQSTYYNTGIESYNFLDSETILKDCIKHYKSGVNRYSIVTSGRALNDHDFEKAIESYRLMSKNCKINLCASHGLLNYEQFLILKNSGVTRYHCNIETSAKNFKNICTTHSFDEKIETIKKAKNAGLEICSGGIIGMGETMTDRISMAFTLAELGVNSIPINVLTPIKNTPFENNIALTENEILRTIAIFRFINPRADIRIAAGRKLIKNNGLKAFFSGANSTITGDYLTTTGSTIADDIKMFKENGFKIKETEL